MRNDNNSIPVVSIVLPTYNGEKYLAAAIESCLHQTYDSIELIIVNDCSTDSTPAIIDHYASVDPRIIVITNKTNQTLPGALNTGFERALGRYFTWSSDDNLFEPEAIETLISGLQQSGADICYSSYGFMDESGAKLDRFGYPPEALIFKCAPGACFLYKAEVHQQLHGFDETKFRMEDMDFWLRAAPLFRFHFVNHDIMYWYRKHSGSLSNEILTRPMIYDKYRENHIASFKAFFEQSFQWAMSDKELRLHVELYFEDILKGKIKDFHLSEKVIAYLNYLDKLSRLAWGQIGFDETIIHEVIENKKRLIVQSVINDLVFENRLLKRENPSLARTFNKPISWYYKEYEVLPSWYKKAGHIIKAIQGNRPWRTLLRNQSKT